MIDRSNIESAVICEDIRTEVNNKLILIGVFTSDFVVPQLPAALRLALYLAVRGVPAGEHEFEIRLSGGEAQSGITGLINVQDPSEIAVLVTPPMPAIFVAEGSFFWQLRIGDSDWVDVLQKRLMLGAVTAPFQFVEDESPTSPGS